MKTVPNSVAAVNKASWDAGVRLTSLGVEAFARVIKLQTQAAIGLYAQSDVPAMLFQPGSRGENVVHVWAKWPQLVVEKTVAYGRDLADVALFSQSGTARILDDAFSDFRRDVLESVEKNIVHAPTFGGAWSALSPQSALNAMTSLLDATNDGMKQITHLGDSPKVPALAANTRVKKRVSKKSRRK